MDNDVLPWLRPVSCSSDVCSIVESLVRSFGSMLTEDRLSMLPEIIQNYLTVLN